MAPAYAAPARPPTVFFRPLAISSLTHQQLPMSRAAVIAASGHSEPPLAELARFRLAATIAADPALARERKRARGHHHARPGRALDRRFV
jgi:hypothetical protein